MGVIPEQKEELEHSKEEPEAVKKRVSDKYEQFDKE